MNTEYTPIVVWKDNSDLIDIIKKKFEVVDTFLFSFNNLEEMKTKMNEVYYPHKIRNTDKRLQNRSCKVLVLKIDNPEYSIFSRKEHKNKPLNKTIIKFKEELRKKYHYSYFHSADYLNESQHVYDVFQIKKYIINYKFIKLSNLKGVVWIDPYYQKNPRPRSDLKDISDTPHYLYLNNSKKEYIDYTTSGIDRKHSPKKYDRLINDINSEKFIHENINNICLRVSYCTRLDKYIIIDGLHRASIYLNNNIEYIKCRMIKKNKFL
jgi:hypothetical protein